MGISLKKIGQRLSQGFDQANPFDNGRTYQNRTPVNTRSVIGQATHNGATNVVGNSFVKPAIRVPINVSNVLYNNAVAPVIGTPHLTPQQVKPISGVSKFTGATGGLAQTAGDIIQTGANLAIPGSSSVVKGAFRAVAPKIVPDIALRATANAGVGAVGGAVNNVGAGLSNNQIHSINDLKNQALTGAKFGAVLGGAGTIGVAGAKTGLNKVRAPKPDTANIQELNQTRQASLKEFHATKSPKVAQTHIDNINNIDKQLADLGAKKPRVGLKPLDQQGGIRLPNIGKEYDKNVEMIPTKELSKYAEFDRGGSKAIGGQKAYDKLKADIQKNGIKSPLTLNYHAGDRTTYLGEGNTRLAVAKELGIKKLPVEVSGVQSKSMTASRNIKVPGREPDQFGYVPSNQRPSDIGISTKYKVGLKKLNQEGKLRLPFGPKQNLRYSSSNGSTTISGKASAVRKQLAQEPSMIKNVFGQWVDNPAYNPQGGYARVPGRAEPQVNAPVQEAKKGLAMEIKRGMSDKDQVILDELKSIQKQTGQKGLVDKFMYNSNMQRGSNAIANNMLGTSKNLRNAIGGLNKNDYKAFSDYANARTELSTAGPKTHTSQSLSDLQAIVDRGNPNLKPGKVATRFSDRFDALNAHYKELADEAYRGGLIDKSTFDRYVANNDYVRLQRDMGDLIPPATSGRGNSISLGKTILSQKRKGSSRATLPAGETAADYTQRVYGEVARNKTATHLVDTLSKNGLATKLDTATAARNTNNLKILRDGKTEYYQVSPEIKQAADNINPYHMNAVMQILAAPGRVLRTGVTGLNPVFIARNLIKDQAGSAINSEHLLATHNPVSFFTGLKNATTGSVGANHDPLWHEFLKHYGDQTSYDLTRNVKNTQNIVNEIRGGTAYKVLDAAKSPLRSLENVAQITEKSTRFQNFRGEYKKALSQGLSKEQASEKAAISAWQNSVDFSRAGTWGRVINTVIPYWNPATQGVRQMGRTFVKHPIKSPLTGAAILGVPLATATAWNLSSPDTKATYDKIPEYEKDNNLVLVEPGKGGGYIKIPLPPGYKDVFMPVRRSLEAFHHDKPLDAKQIGQDILQATTGPVATQTADQFKGSFIPQALKPAYQQSINRDLYTGKAIVPDYVNQATDANGNPIPENKKAYKYSSGTAKIIGDKTNTSPIRVEKFVKDTGGTVASNVLNAVDKQLANRGVISKDNIGGQSVRTGFKRSFTGNVKEFEKSAGAKYYENIKKVTSNLTGNEQAAFNALHPTKKNFLGDTIYTADKVYDPASRLDTYNRYPKVFEADKKLDSQAKIHNPLFSLQSWQVKKVLEKDNLPPGAKDPELSKLYDQPWYADYATAKSKYFTASKAAAEKAGKPFGTSDNPYPVTSDGLQKVMDTYSSLPKGTGARSAWIKANPGQWTSMQNQFAKIDDWQNVQRGKRGLDATEGATGIASGYGDSTKTYSSYGGSKTNPTLNADKYRISLKAGGSAPKSIKVAKVSKSLKHKVAIKSTPSKITVRKSRV